jgi:S1-C subfamily serine protease
VIRPWLAVAAALAAPAAGCGGHGTRPPRPAVLEVAVTEELRPDEIATGFALGPGRVVTVAHVLGARRVGARVRVRPPGGRGRGRGRPATVASIDEGDDLAVLDVPGLHAPSADLERAAGAVVVLALRGGRVQALAARVRRSIVARIRTPDGRRIVRRPALELGVDVRPGDSGAPVLTSGGRVAGVVFAISERRPRTAYAVDLSRLRRRPARTAATG